ncbi:MAG: hypothetical protein KatS3mg085_580 [Candidatus Dojkabacteria bacterium]|nr:MAG: hypothetical protein KatS3mg085_580 [Candidatus Dojkabacteria bacterium]
MENYDHRKHESWFIDSERVDDEFMTILLWWCEINCIVVNFVNRKERSSDDLITLNIENFENVDKVYVLTIPNDLRYEELKIIEQVIKKSFGSLNEKNESKILSFAKFVENLGIYIHIHSDQITEGNEIASNIANNLYKYGRLLQGKSFSNNSLYAEDLYLSSEELEEIDKYLLGSTNYNKRINKEYLNHNLTNIRKRYLRLWFYTLSRNKTYPFNSNQLTQKLLQNLSQKPTLIMYSLILNLGMKFLLMYLPTNEEMRSLYQILDIEARKLEIQNLRNGGNISIISEAEYKFAQMIQKYIVNNYNYEKEQFNPTDIYIKKTINCVGASLLGISLLQELDIDCLLIHSEDHAAIVFFTSDGTAYLMDLTPYGNNMNFRPLPLLREIDIKTNLSNNQTLYIPEWGTNVTLRSPEEGLLLVILNNNSVIFYRKQKYNIAIKLLEIILNIDPNYSNAYFMLGCVYNDQANINNAIENFQKAISINPFHYKSYIELGKIYLINKDYDKAIEAFEHAKQINPRGISYTQIAELYAAMGNYDEALNFCRKEVGDEAESYHMLAMILKDQQKYNEAIDYLNKSLSINKYYFIAHIDIIYIYMEMNRYDLALQYINETLEKFKNDEEATSILNCILEEIQFKLQN